LGRPKKLHKPATTTIPISTNLRNDIKKLKWRGTTLVQFCDKVFAEWADFKESNSTLEVAYDRVSKDRERFLQTLDELMSLAGVKTVEELKAKLRGQQKQIIHLDN